MKPRVLGTWYADHLAEQRRARQAEVDALHAAIIAAVDGGRTFRSGEHFAARSKAYPMWITRAFRAQHGHSPSELFRAKRLEKMRALHQQGLGSAAIARRVGLDAYQVRAMLGIESTPAARAA